MQRLSNPVPLFLDSRGALLDAGKIYIGTADQDPEDNPVSVFWDSDLSLQADQPLRTLGGVIMNGENPAFIYLANGDYSMRVRDANDVLVTNIPSVSDLGGIAVGGDYQPIDADLTAISGLATTSYGRNLLTLANQAALQAAVGGSASLPTIGGTVTGNITRGGAGVHLYHSAAGMTSGRVFLTASADPDPTSLPGDIWLTY